MMLRCAGLLFLTAILFGCSSLPNRGAVLPKEVTRGMQLLRQARLDSRMNQHKNAQLNAEKAYRYFLLADDLNGLFFTNLELTKLYRTADSKKSKRHLLEAKNIAEVFRPELKPAYNLRLAELKFLENDFVQTLSLIKNHQLDVQSESLSAEANAYKIMAMLKLKQKNGDEQEPAQNLAAIYDRLKDQYDDYELSDPEVLSFSAYVLGLFFASKKMWSVAQKWFLAAWTIDRQISNYSGTAENLYSLGVVKKSLGERAAARGFFQRAKRVFEVLQKTTRAKACQVQIQALK